MIYSLENVSDYLAPQQVCIKPIESNLEPVTIEIDKDIHYEVTRDGHSRVLKPASINLNDCLACSGCVTSSEAVIVTAQSYEQVMRELSELNSSKRIAVASVSPQTLASFAEKYSITPESAFRKIKLFFEKLNVKETFDTSIGRDLSLMECAKDFISRYEIKKLPLLTSSCPGWICYAEKVYGDLIPFITTAKSPHQIMGSFIKECISKVFSVEKRDVYHFCVTSCYDKKLESARKEFEYNGIRDIDCTITSLELEKMIADKGYSFAEMEESSTPPLYASFPHFVLGSEGSSSGGYQAFVLRLAALKLFNISLSISDIENGSKNVIIRDLDMNCKELTLVSDDQSVLLKAIRVYGFKNIQNVVRAVRGKFKTEVDKSRVINFAKKAPGASFFAQNFHFIEIMACPGGCVNGGGQLSSTFGENISRSDALSKISRVEHYYQKINENKTLPEVSTPPFYESWLNSSPFDCSKTLKLHTTYTAIEKQALLAKW